jgi:carboxymethylenebutenolidase
MRQGCRPTGRSDLSRIADFRCESSVMPRPELDSLLPTRDYSRRDFVRTAVGSGFAAAVLPVTAQTIRTDSAGLTVGEVTVGVDDFKMPAYRAMPAGRSGLPVVLVV